MIARSSGPRPYASQERSHFLKPSSINFRERGLALRGFIKERSGLMDQDLRQGWPRAEALDCELE
jgi:hypothetical protein